MSIQDVSWKDIIEKHQNLYNTCKSITNSINEKLLFPNKSTLDRLSRKDSKDMQLLEPEEDGYLPSLKQLKEWEELTKDEWY